MNDATVTAVNAAEKMIDIFEISINMAENENQKFELRRGDYSRSLTLRRSQIFCDWLNRKSRHKDLARINDGVVMICNNEDGNCDKSEKKSSFV